MFFLLGVSCLRLEPFQTMWQASLPIPINITYDVPAASFIQKGRAKILPTKTHEHEGVLGNAFVLNLHEPEETTEILNRELDAIKFKESNEGEESRREHLAESKILLDSVRVNVRDLVEELLKPLEILPDPFV